jgi:putative transposase
VDLPLWRLVWHYSSTWKKAGLWPRLNAALRGRAGKRKAPTAAIIDSQSVRTACDGARTA